jgi:Tol biopolymer transport system component
MRIRSLIAGVAALAAFLTAPAVSQASLVFTRNPFSPVVYAANDDGSAARKVGSGSNPRISPDGKTMVFFRSGRGQQPSKLMVASTAGGTPSGIALNWRDPFVFDWSPDSTTVAVVLGPELGKQRLTTISLANGVQRVIARGYFSGVSFSPQGGQLVYGRAANESFPPRSDLYQFDIPIPGAVYVAAPRPHRLTTDHRSFAPLWGPSGRVVFVKHLDEKSRKYGPKNDLFLINLNRDKVKRLTHTKVDPLLSGLSPTEWSNNGTRLLTEFGGQDTSYAVTVNPKTGAERALTREREVGFVGTALSSDGKFVLGSIGGFEPGPDHKVVSIPYAGGKPTVLANNASEPDWSR